MSQLNQRLAQLSPEQRAILEAKLLQKKAPQNNKSFVISKRDTSDPCPLSPAQQRLWFLHQMQPESSAYHMPITLRLQGVLNFQALQQTLTVIVERHEALRTQFIATDGVPVQVVVPGRDVDLYQVDLRTQSPEQQESALESALEKISDRPFDLTSDLMLRAGLIQLGDQEYVLQIIMHHIAADGWSVGVFLRELKILYQAFSSNQPNPLPELTIQYADFSEWQRQRLSGEVLENQLNYWEQQLAGAPPLLELPTDHPRPPVQTLRGHTLPVEVSSDLTEALKTLNQSSGTTLFMTLFAAFATLLYRYSGQTDIVIGSTIANRPQAEVEALIGLFLNTVALRTNLEGNPTFRNLLEQVKQVILDAYAHQDVPFEQLLETLRPVRDLSYSPWFQVMFIFQNYPSEAIDLPDLSISPQSSNNQTAKFDLTLTMWETPQGLEGTLEYNTDLFETATVSQFLEHFKTLLEGIVSAPDKQVAALPLAATGAQLVDNKETPHLSNLVSSPQFSTIHKLFENRADLTPNAAAVEFQDQQLTYQDLNTRANQLACYLQSLGVGPDVLVGLCIDRSIDMIVGLLGILKAGGAYVPLDPTYPQERLAMMLTDAQPKVIVTLQSLDGSLPQNNIPLVCLDRDWQTIACHDSENRSEDTQPDNLAYVIYTSGSTGKPKGVMIEHRALVNFVTAAISEYQFTACDRILQFASINFDAAIEEIFGCLCSGGTLVLRTDEMLSSSAFFMQQCQDLKLTVLDLPTAYWHQLTSELASTDCLLPSALRLVIIGGEKALSAQIRQWQQWVRASSHHAGTQSAPAQLVNTYGPTEATVVATCYRVPYSESDEMADVPIGQSLPNVHSHILDTNLQPVPKGVAGELYIGGLGVARGYLNRPDLTRERFIPDPFRTEAGAKLYKTGDLVRCLPDGNLKFLGRVDYQVKIRGFRIELGEIETALSQYPAVNQAVVVAREDEPGDKRLVAYVVMSSDESLSNGDLRQFLKQTLPSYMLPSAFVQLECLPLTPNGKVNRQALPKPETSDLVSAATYVAPRTPIEQQLAEIWSQVLKLERVGIHDNFFELGGHSLLAAQVIARIQDIYQVRLPLLQIFELPTITKLAEPVENKLWFLQQAQASQNSNSQQLEEGEL